MGNLPLSRTATINTGDPIPPALINEMEDMIIGGRYGSQLIVVSGAGFLLRSGTGTETDGRWSFTVVPAVLHCQLWLTPGMTIEELDTFYNRNGAGTITSKLRSKSLTGPTAAADIASITDAASGAYHGAALVLPPGFGGAIDSYLVPGSTSDLKTFWLEITVSNVANTVEGFAMIYHK